MHKTLILAAGLALAATSTLAQGAWRDRDDNDRRGWRENRDRDDGRGRSMREDDGDDVARSRGARFFLRSGDARVVVRCDDRESTRACVDATLTLFDRMKSQAPSSSSTSSAPGGTGSNAPSTTSPAR